MAKKKSMKSRYRKAKRDYLRLMGRSPAKSIYSGSRQHRQGVSTRQTVTLRYVETISLNPSIGTIDSFMFSANGVYDPNFSGVGHQPRMFDQWMTFYSHAVVIGSKCTVKFLNEGVSGNSNQVVGVRLSPNTTSYSVPNEYYEDEWTKYKSLGLTGAGKCTVSQTFSPKTFLGRSKPLSDPNLKNTTSSNPTESAYYDIFAAPMNLTDDPAGVDCLVIIDYLCVFIEPLHVGQS